MKFIESLSSVGRTGILFDFPTPWSAVKFCTPLCLTHTRGGTVPHLTANSLKYLEKDPIFSMQTLPTVIDFKDAVKTQGLGLGTFTGSAAQTPFFLSVQDPGTPTPSGYNTKKGVAVFAHGGKRYVTAESYIEAVECFRPACYQALCDSDTAITSTTKRLNKSVDQTLKYLDDCIEYHSKRPELSSVGIFGTIEGGFELPLRKKSASETARRPVDGFVIEGFHQNGPSAQRLDFDSIRHLLSETLALLPRNKPRILSGAFGPEFMLEAIKCGIDVFDSSYAYVLSESAEASIFPLEFVPQYFQQDSDSKKRPKLLTKICLIDSEYKNDFTPILKGCKCYTCAHYSKAYVNHLLVTSELLGQILLMIHNLHHMSEFFDAIQKTMKASISEDCSPCN